MALIFLANPDRLKYTVYFRYHFNLHGTIKELNPPNKAIVHFTLNGREERALLLAKMAVIDGKALEDVMKPTQTICDYFKLNESISFDCHIYDKGTVIQISQKCS